MSLQKGPFSFLLGNVSMLECLVFFFLCEGGVGFKGKRSLRTG